MWWNWAAACVAFLLGNGLQIGQAALRLPSVSQARGVALLALLACGGCLWWQRRRPPPTSASTGWVIWAPALMLGLSLAALGWAHAEARAAARLAQRWQPPAGPVWLQGQVRTVTPVESGALLEVQVERAGPGLGPCAPADDGQTPTPSKPWWPERVSLSVAAQDAPVDVEAGERWCWPVRLHEPGTLMNPAGFDAQRWWFEKGVRAQGRVLGTRAGGVSHRLAPARWWSAGALERMRMSLARRVQRHVPAGRTQGLVLGLTIGDQAAIAPTDWDTLRDTGLAHVASISGTHVLMMAWLVAGVTGWAWRRSVRLMQGCPAPVAARWAGLLAALAYALLAGWGVPAQRTVLMLAVVTLLRAGALRWPPVLVLLVAAVAVVLLDPWAPGQAGFWLSFAAVALLMLSDQGQALPDAGAGADAPDGGAAAGALTRFWRSIRGAARAGVKTQMLATVALAPLSMVFFQQVSLVGLLANLPGLPVFTLVLTPLALAGLVWPALWRCMPPVADALFAFLQRLASWPWATWSTPEVWPWAMAPALLAVAWMVPRWPGRWRWASAPLLCWLLWPPALAQRWPRPEADHFEVHVADVGQGTAVLLRTRHHALLYDTGPQPPGVAGEGRDAGRRVLLGLMRSVGVTRLDRLVISHGDLDHIGGARSVLAGVPVRSLITSVQADDPHLQWPQAPGRVPPVQPCMAGQGWTWDGVRFEFLHPAATDLADRENLGDNALSCVLHVRRLSRSTDSVLLTGDAERPQEEAMLARDAGRLAAQVLVVPHHGSRTSSTPAFIEAVNPEVALVQAGARNRYGHPAPAVVRRYEAAGVLVKASATCGDWVWRTGDGSAAAAGRCWRDMARRYWHETPVTAETRAGRARSGEGAEP